MLMDLDGQRLGSSIDIRFLKCVLSLRTCTKSYNIFYTLALGELKKVALPHLLGLVALGVGRAHRYFYFLNGDAVLSPFYRNNQLPGGCGFVGINQWIGVGHHRPVQVDFSVSQPLTRDQGMEYSEIHVLVRHGASFRSLLTQFHSPISTLI